MLDVVIEAAIKSAIVIWALLTAFAYLTLTERKVMGRMQARIGPNRVGPFGFFQPVADGIKLVFKEDVIPAQADRIIHTLAPAVSIIPAVIIFAVIPIGPPVTLFGREIKLQIADINIGYLYVAAIASLAVYGIVLGGWASNSKYSLLGAMRSSAQMISYELAQGLAVLSVILMAGSLSLNRIVELQLHGLWNIIPQFLGFIVYYIAGIAETNRAPFDLPEAEGELGAGYHTEYSGFKWSAFFMAEYVNMVNISALVTVLYLGGWAPGWIFPPIWFLLKVAFLLLVFIWLRATLPRLRYDRLMALGWKILLPLALLNLFATATVVALT
jgi:NADH-quinone oxidoreductase subunit H